MNLLLWPVRLIASIFIKSARCRHSFHFEARIAGPRGPIIEQRCIRCSRVRYLGPEREVWEK